MGRRQWQRNSARSDATGRAFVKNSRVKNSRAASRIADLCSAETCANTLRTGADTEAIAPADTNA